MGYVSASNTPTVVQQFGYGTATGGIGAPTAVTISGVNYEYLTFNATGTLTVTTAGWFDFLAIGGGTGHIHFGSDTAGGNGGGGCGVVLSSSIYLSANQTITIGAGGSFVNYINTPSQGGATSIGSFISASGGLVGTSSTGVFPAFTGGGAGGYAGYNPLVLTTPYGSNGGTSIPSGGGGGGGGNSSVGGNAVTTTGGTGGAGYDISTFIGGSASYRATGGGGGGTTAGGSGGSSNASSNSGSTNTTPSSAAANIGSGGGAGRGTPTTGNGGSGVCFIRWKV
jgi:hypothetical protein